MAPGNVNANHIVQVDMKNLIIAGICLLAAGCATIADKGKMEEYGRTMDTYETALYQSDFNIVCQHVDPAAMTRGECLERFHNMEIANYEVLAVNVADDQREVNLAVELEYFFLDQYVVKKMQFDQTWQYKEAQNRWFLKSGPPVFK